MEDFQDDKSPFQGGVSGMSTPKDTGRSLTVAIEEAQRIIEAAKKRAENILAQAHRDAVELQEASRKEGIQKGQAEVVETSIRLIEGHGGRREALAREAAKLALLISEKIIGEQIRLEPEIIKHIAATTLQKTLSGDAAIISVNPEDAQVLRSSQEDLSRVCSGATITIREDLTMARGGCVVRTGFGEVDLSLEVLLSEVANRLGLQTRRVVRGL